MAVAGRGEKEILLAYLDGQRRHVLGILEGLSEEDLQRPVLPSGWTCAGLVRHLALDVERFWFRVVEAGEAPELEDDAWTVPPGTPGQSMLGLYRDEIEAANAVITRTPLDAPPRWWPEERWPDGRMQDLRQIMLHVIAETACHAGHLDAVRELIDGKQWMVLAD